MDLETALLSIGLVKCGDDAYVTDTGEVYRIKRSASAPTRRYLQVTITRNGKQHHRDIHTLVAEAFHGPRPPGGEVRHLDGDRHNNHASNLRWGTSKENSADQVTHGTVHLGVDHHKAKLTPEKIEEARRLHSDHGETWTALGERYGVHRSTIKEAVDGVTWQMARSEKRE